MLARHRMLGGKLCDFQGGVGIHTRIRKENYSTVIFQGEGCPPSGSMHKPVCAVPSEPILGLILST